jgi:hypothetical protein
MAAFLTTKRNVPQMFVPAIAGTNITTEAAVAQGTY